MDWLIDRGSSLPNRAEHPEREAIAEIIDSLPLHHREALHMYYFEGKTYREIAEYFGLAGRSSGMYRVKAAEAAFADRYEVEW